MAAENKQEATAASGSRPAPCADGLCDYFSATPMCSRCYAEKVLQPMEELEAVLAEIRRVNSGKQHQHAAAASRDRAVAEARNVVVTSSRCGGACRTKKASVRNCS